LHEAERHDARDAHLRPGLAALGNRGSGAVARRDRSGDIKERWRGAAPPLLAGTRNRPRSGNRFGFAICKRAFVHSRDIAPDPAIWRVSLTELRGAAKKLKRALRGSLDPYLWGGVIA
jgi:hypothetical protein